MSQVEKLTPGQAQYILGRALDDKKIRSREIDKYLREMDQEIENLEQRLSKLRNARAGGDAAKSTRASKSRKRKAGKK
ncbi:MAG: hypothetical protein R3338_15555, partial [Thermoanaerobaculia bacterium]|nr:hypothetical protein [Thermoanaerobaculia bacterium]